jgi:hypothetical protein
MGIDTQDADGIRKQKADLVDKLWQVGNLLVGYGVVQGITLAVALANSGLRTHLLTAYKILAPVVVMIGALLAMLVHTIGSHEMRLRSNLGVDESLVRTVRSAVRWRLWIIALTHATVAAVIVAVGLRASK